MAENVIFEVFFINLFCSIMYKGDGVAIASLPKMYNKRLLNDEAGFKWT